MGHSGKLVEKTTSEWLHVEHTHYFEIFFFLLNNSYVLFWLWIHLQVARNPSVSE